MLDLLPRSSLVALVAALVLSACPGGGGAGDGGLLGSDAGRSVDGGFKHDAGVTVDAGGAFDAGVDAGARFDGGLTVDSGAADDAGANFDAGSTIDAGITADAGPTTDAGTGVDAGIVDAFDGGWVLPVYRVGPRSTFGHLYGPTTITGTLTVPRDGGLPGLTTVTIRSRADEAPVSLSPVAVGDTWQATFSVSLRTATSGVEVSRELFSLSLPGEASSFLGTSQQGSVNFSLGSTALQVLSLAQIRENADPFYEVYQHGLNPGDDPRLDALQPSIETVLRAQWLATGQLPVSGTGFVTPGTAVFTAVDDAISSFGAPRVYQPRGSSLTSVVMAGAGGQLALYVSSIGPRPQLVLPAGTRQVSIFLFEGSETQPIYLRQRLLDGGQSHASAVFTIEPSDAGLSSDPNLTLTTTTARVCGLTQGNEALFFSSGTEVAVGFARVVIGADGCASIARSSLPADIALLTATEVTASGEMSGPSSAVFP